MDYNKNEFDMLSESEEDSVSEEESGESDDSDEDDSEEDETVGEYEANGNAEERLNGSDDDPERECCPVCLNKFIGQDLGTPESCEHTFCFQCIKEWSKNINTCPIDRTEFNFIHLRAVPRGSILRKVKVKVMPKEAEETLQENVTLCEVCHSGDREDRLLLCDGCDLAFHCECLDPPLFYIPIEEWFCPPCSGVFQDRAVAGPSHSRTRRIIPRTRASETVRSRVQNLRTTGSSTPRSTSQQRKTPSTKSPKKRRRRYYRRSIKKVVKLARTQKDMSSAQKGKLATRSSAVIVTYRRRRRRKAKRKVSKRSVASTRAIPIPSSKQRIAKRLGISKPFEGSTVPQVKPTVKSRATSRVAKKPTHSLFGNKDQLMDFSENFSEDLSNVPSTSTSVPLQRPSSDSLSSMSSLNLLDSIMAGQKILHSKSKNIVIKTDGSLIIKDESSSINKTNSPRKEVKPLPRTPMSIALVKDGARNLPSSKKNSGVSWKKHADISKSKNTGVRKLTKFTSEKVNSMSEAASSTQKFSNNSYAHTELPRKSGSYEMKSSGLRNSNGDSSINLHAIKGQKSQIKKLSISKVKFQNNFSLNTGESASSDTNKTNKFVHKEMENVISKFQSPMSYSFRKDLCNDTNSHQLKNIRKQKTDLELKKNNDTALNFLSNKLEKLPLRSVNSSKSTSISVPNKPHPKLHIKNEILSDNETDSDLTTSNAERIKIKQEVPSDDESKLDCCISNDDTVEHKTSNSFRINIKKEPTDLSTFRNNNHCDVSQNVEDFYASGTGNFSHGNKCEYSIPLQKVKEEMPSDSEADYSQSIVSNADTVNLESYVKSALSTKDFISSPTERSRKMIREKKNKNTCLENDLPCTQVTHSPAITDSEDDDIPCTQAAPSPAVDTDSEDEWEKIRSKWKMIREKKNKNSCLENDLPCTQVTHSPAITDSEDDDIPCTQAAPSPAVDTDSEDDEIPYAQAANSPAMDTDSEDDEIPYAQAANSPAITDSEDEDLPCTQAAPSPAVYTDSECDDIPCAQAAHSPALTDSEDDDIPCTQVALCTVTDSDDNDMPCTQVSFKNLDDNDTAFTQEEPITRFKSSNIGDLPCTQAVHSAAATDSEDDEIPCTQAAPIYFDSSDDDLPCTQAVSHSSIKNEITSNFLSSDDTASDLSDSMGKITDAQYKASVNNKHAKRINDSLPCTQIRNVAKTISNNDIPSTQMNCEFLKPDAIPIKRKKCYKGTSSETSNTDSSSKDQLPSISQFKKTGEILNKNDINFSIQQQKNSKSKKIVDHCHVKNLAVTDDDLSLLLATQVSSAIPKYTTNFLEAQVMAESPELASTQISNMPSKVPIFSDTLDVTHGAGESSEAFSLPETQFVACESPVVPDSQALCADDESFALPATQISNPCLKEKSSIVPDNESGTSNSSGDDKLDNGNKRMEVIISNIKQLVNSLSANNQDISNLPSVQNESKENKSLNISNNNDVSRKSNILVESTDSEDISKDKSSIYNYGENEQNSLSSTDSENEELSTEKLKEILKNSCKINIPKKVGIHKHLPQVIATVPAKTHVRIKPNHKRTFSFEEVAKLEMPAAQEKILNTFPVKVNFENNSADSFINMDDSLPLTQRVESKSVDRCDESKKSPKIDFKKSESKDCFSSHAHYFNKINEKLNRKAGMLSNKTLKNSPETEIQDFPATQVAKHIKESVSDLPDTQISMENLKSNPSACEKELFSCNSKNSSKAVQFNSLSNPKSQNVKTEVISSSDREEYSLPATQTQHFSNKNNLSLERKNIHNVAHSSYSLKRNDPASRNIKTNENNSCANSSVEKRSLISESQTHKQIKHFSNELFEFDDLPATQACNNVDIQVNYKLSEHSNEVKTLIKKSHDGLSNNNKLFDKSTISSSIADDNLCKKKKQDEQSDVSKRKCSSEDVSKQKSRLCDLPRKELDEAYPKANRDHNKGSKRSLDYQKYEKELNQAKSLNKNLSSKKLKLEANEYSCKKSDQPDPNNIDSTEGNFITNKISDIEQSVTNITSKVTIKQEKLDFDFVKPNLEMFASCKSVSSNSDIIKIKLEDSVDDFLPPTQAVNTDSLQEDSLPPTQLVIVPKIEKVMNALHNFDEKSSPEIQNSTLLTLPQIKKEMCLAPSRIEKEVCYNVEDDDDIEIIEIDQTSSAKTKESIVISIDDDDDFECTRNKKLEASPVRNEKSVKDSENVSSKFQVKSKSSNSSKLQQEKKNHIQDEVLVFKHKGKSRNSDWVSNEEEKIKQKNDLIKPQPKHSKNDPKHLIGHSNSRREKEQYSLSKSVSSDAKCIKSGVRHNDFKDSSSGKNKEKESSDSNHIKNDSKHTDSTGIFTEKSKQGIDSDSRCLQRDSKSIGSDTKYKQSSSLRNHLKFSNLKSMGNDSKHSDSKSMRNYSKDRDSKSVGSDSKHRDLQSVGNYSNHNDSKSLKTDSKYSYSKSLGRKSKHKDSKSEGSDSIHRESKSLGSNSKPKDSKCLSVESNLKPKDLAMQKTKAKKQDNSSLKPKSLSSDAGNIYETVKNKISELVSNEQNSKDSNKERKNSSDKENSKKSQESKHEVIITLKPMSGKRPHEIAEIDCRKKMKSTHSLDSESYSTEDISNHSFGLQNGFLNCFDTDIESKSGCYILNDDISTPSSDKGMEDLTGLNTSKKKYLKSSLKISRKEELQEEIANEVKLVLKPFFCTGLITKDDYKDIMRRAVNKIFMNCHNCINPEKIRKLVLSYVALINKS